MRILTALLVGSLMAAAQLPAAKTARDHADAATLQRLTQEAGTRATAARTATAYIEAAQIAAWWCEAAQDKQQTAMVTQAATAGADSAQKAIALDPKLSEAYRLRGTLLGQLIAGGGMMAGMRYGSESTADLAKAVQLDPKNARAHVDRAIGLLFTPAAFGGSTSRAIVELQQAVKLAPELDTTHLWLAQAYLQNKQSAAALTEAEAAFKLDPARVFTQYVLQQARAAASHHAK